MNKAVIIQNGIRRVISFSAPQFLNALLPDQPQPCGGKGFCGHCRVRVRGRVSAPTEAESARLTSSQLADGIRLACQTQALGDVTITVRGQAQTFKASTHDVPIQKPLGTRFGFAIDLGTTTLYTALYDLKTGTRCGEASAANPQTHWGADVLSRLEQAMNGHQNELSRRIRHALFDLCAQLLIGAHLAPSDVDAAVLVGNTAMLYLLFDLNPSSISCAPFRCETLFGAFYAADFLPVRAGTKVFVPRCISAFLGADTVAAALFSGMQRTDSRILADLGTNGEILLRAGNKLYGCSCAAGPAFEGVGLECGMPYTDGAVCSAFLSGGQLIYKTCANAAPAGICGSGYTDWIACLRKTGDLQKDGTLKSTRVYLTHTPLYITQKDVRAFQLAKSAVRTAIEILLDRSGGAEIHALDIAGSFGASLRVRSAAAIGLVPPQLLCVTHAVGNAAAAGAAMLLLDDTLPQTAADLAAQVEPVSLADQPDFQDRLCQNLSLE